MDTTIPLDRAVVLVRASLPAVLQALQPFAAGEPVIDLTPGLERGAGLDESVRGEGRAVLYKPRGADYCGIIREGIPREVHDVPLARRLSRVLDAPAVALHVAARDVGAPTLPRRPLPRELALPLGRRDLRGERLRARLAGGDRDPYGRALAVLQGYGFEDDRLTFQDFARGNVSTPAGAAVT